MNKAHEIAFEQWLATLPPKEIGLSELVRSVAQELAKKAFQAGAQFVEKSMEEARPIGWYKPMKNYYHDLGVEEWNVDCAMIEDSPGEGWLPMFAQAMPERFSAKPIEMAEKDGTKIYAFDPSKGWIVCQWGKHDHVPLFGWVYREHPESQDDFRMTSCEPTHWLSLPAEKSLLLPDDVQWVVNSIAELGVKIGDQFFFMYKGYSLVYAGEPDEDNKQLYWRPIKKREFGESCYPIHPDQERCGYSHLKGTVSLEDSPDWKLLPMPPENWDKGDGA
jgi:hypothetical protein